jgi:hypothetical protein
MAKNEDKVRRFVLDGTPVATGVVAVGDSWASSNPSIGRGVTIGFLHALALRDTIGEVGVDDPAGLVTAFAEATEERVLPWVEATLSLDRARVKEIRDDIDGTADDLPPAAAIGKAFQFGALHDAELWRCLAEVGGMLASSDEVFGRPGVFDRVLEAGADWRDAPRRGPDRTELLALLGA